MGKKIEEAKVHVQKDMFDFGGSYVEVRFEGDEEWTRLFDYYPDEIRFSSDEFIGLTDAEARHLKFKKDKAYLQS